LCYFLLISKLNATICLSPILFCFMFFLLINIYKINITFLCCLPDMCLKLYRKMLTLLFLLGKKRYWIKWSMLLIIFHRFLFLVSFVIQEACSFYYKDIGQFHCWDFDVKQVAATDTCCRKCFKEFSALHSIIIFKFSRQSLRFTKYSVICFVFSFFISVDIIRIYKLVVVL
jgi:hypothetical protein